ncbi:uncharacterized protein [Venturia canescens]|uniref:uncharacterized protein isoform X2 n=1 Tax=Venturia canescens TaxID=32260 RepID=UPI001C9C7851|nr:uncharacterized protein LOC122412901 isoform X2 [Venturia canescens]
MEAASACSSPATIMGGHQTAKRKFFQWAVKWFYANMAEDNLEKPDAPILVCLLQSIGFQLRDFEKIEESNRTTESKPDENTVRIFVECGTSGMRACLELNDVKCKCPNSEVTKDASFWSVSGVGGTGPMNTAKKSSNRIEESGSNLLPPVSKETGKILHDVAYHLLNIIAEKPSDINRNSKNQSNLNLSSIHNADNKDVSAEAEAETLKNLSTNIVRSYTQPEIVLPHAGARKFKWTAQIIDKIDSDNDRNGSKWSTDLESEIIDNDQPRPSPPKIASSPVFMNQLCNSLSQISLQSEEEASSVVEHVKRARKNLDKALEILVAKNSPNSRNSPTLEEGTFLKPAPGGLNLTAGGSRRLSSCSSGSLRSPLGSARSRQSSSFSLPARESSFTQTRKATNQATISKSSTSNVTRRSVSSVHSTSMVAASNAGATMKRQTSNVDQNSTTSKIPGRRKSFGVLGSQPLKLAASSARNTANSLKRKSPEPKGTTTLNQSSIQKANSSINQPPATLKFGFVRKKSSLV